MRFLLLDYETRSSADLRMVGAWEYSRHPSTKILCAAWKVGTKAELRSAPVHSWSPALAETKAKGGELVSLLLDPNLNLVSHNSFFEQSITTNVLLPTHRPISPARWTCTAARAAALGLPRHLEEACNVLELPVRKDMDGHKLMMKMSRPRRPTKNDSSVWHQKLEDLKRLIKYCETDIEAETELFLSTPPLNVNERKIWEFDQKMNLRGVRVDRRLVEKTIALIGEETALLNDETVEITGGAIRSLTQRDAFRNYINEHCTSVPLPDIQAKTISDALKEKDRFTPTGRRLLEMRQAVGKTSNAKYPKFWARSESDGYSRDNLLYHGAHTGRWTGRGVQLQNVPQGTIKETDFTCELVKQGRLDDVKLLYPSPMEVFSSNLRGCLIPREGTKFFCGDFATIEVRVLFWLAGHAAGLKAFRDKRDLYREMATVIYRVALDGVTKPQREVAKRAVLGAGYGLGAKKFRETCEKFGIAVTEELAQRAVESYRGTHSPVPILWSAVQAAAIAAVETPGKRYEAGKCKWFVEGRFLWCELPSKRRLAYYKPAIKWKETPWGEKRKTLYHWTEDDASRWVFEHTYGGKLVENITQAIARDCMAESMLALEENDFHVVLSVHDEVLCEGRPDRELAQFETLMAKVPEWGPEIPIKVEAWTGARYGKR